MDPDAKLFYRELLDFGPGVGFQEKREKFMRKEREFDAQEKLRMDNIAMNPSKSFLNSFMNKNIDLAAGYSPLIPEFLGDKYKKEADIEKYLKNMERLKNRKII